MVGLVVSLAGSAQAPAAAARPDFSGEWVLTSPSDPTLEVARSMTVRQSADGPTRLFVLRRANGLTRTNEYRLGLTGGITGGFGPGLKRDLTTLANSTYSHGWFGDQLVLDESRYAGRFHGDGAFEDHGELWSLEGPDTLHITMTDHVSGSDPRTVKLVYRRK